ncbi:hypothetical protein BU25DRAFT_465237 [Macroventuria anomochaeta]|uniref:Uncharacterized protein n=1 Tax=Macroventuria anomochaeta TaxID=301207 RepID=A0ACB6SIT3_9PLEO|nr:uncharacterized protein BU25DRAFT_465237 [Macroventuria anomochaeta]KAF2634009.1 hypothetical protein BU25DRAFT_465237 [Macroventuria anomochaeta]
MHLKSIVVLLSLGALAQAFVIPDYATDGLYLAAIEPDGTETHTRITDIMPIGEREIPEKTENLHSLKPRGDIPTWCGCGYDLDHTGTDQAVAAIKNYFQTITSSLKAQNAVYIVYGGTVAFMCNSDNIDWNGIATEFITTAYEIITSMCGWYIAGTAQWEGGIFRIGYILDTSYFYTGSNLKSLICTSPSFESDLHKLVLLVHCHNHDAGQPKKRRLEAWKLAFPPDSVDGSVPELSNEWLIRKVLEQLNAECITYDNGRACKRKIGGQKEQNCERTLQELTNSKIYAEDTKLVSLLKVLEWSRTCDIYKSPMQSTWLATWMESLMLVLPLLKLVGRRALASSPSNEPKASSEAQARLSIATAPLMAQKVSYFKLRILPPQASLGPVISTDADPALNWPKAYDSSHFNIVAHVNHDARSTRSYARIRTTIRKLLDTSDLRDGYVYSYGVEGNEGYFIKWQNVG